MHSTAPHISTGSWIEHSPPDQTIVRSNRPGPASQMVSRIQKVVAARYLARRGSVGKYDLSKRGRGWEAGLRVDVEESEVGLGGGAGAEASPKGRDEKKDGVVRRWRTKAPVVHAQACLAKLEGGKRGQEERMGGQRELARHSFSPTPERPARPTRWSYSGATHTWLMKLPF